MDSMAVFRKMMGSMRTKVELETAEDESARIDMQNDIARIENARDIFKNLDESNGPSDAPKAPPAEKHKRVEVKPDFLLEGQNKAEAIRKERLKEIASMKAARERALEDEEMFNRENKQKSDELKRQREMEIELMRMARQEAIEEEERMEQLARKENTRAISPGLLAAKNVQNNRDFVDSSQNKMDQMRMERNREMEEMRRARENMDEDDYIVGNERSEATRELEAFRASRGCNIKERYRPEENQNQSQSRSQAFTKAPKMKAKADSWMKNASQDKMEEARYAREREMEALMVARSNAIEEEEMERAAEEQERRREAQMKANEMAVLVADLQRMREHTARDAEEEAQMTRYQEEMLARVMELHQLARGGGQAGGMVAM